MSFTISCRKSSKVHDVARRILGSASWLGCLAAMFVLMCAVSATAQLSGKGAITGSVTDKTGAVIPNATITATNNATGISTVTKSTGAGDYNFSNLDPGIYTVTTAAQGFAKLAQENVHVNAMESQVYSPVLTVSSTNEVITVTAEPPALETSNATLGATMEQETYAELPIEMGAYGSPDQRRATDFVYLMPGVQGNETNGNATTNTGVVNGSGSRGAVSAVYIDGLPFVRAGGNGDPRYVWTAISVDAVDQFQLQTNGYSAIYEGQGVMNYSVKMGGAKQHGSIYEFFRNTSLDTWGFFKAASPTDSTQLIKPIEHSNEYGINLGGPLLPFGSWKNKLFYFTNYNGFRYSSATPTPIRFPNNSERAGDFSADGVPIYDPSTQAACTANSTNGPCRYQYGYMAGTGTGLAGNPVAIGSSAPVNVIPSSEFSTVVKNLQAVAKNGQAIMPSISSTATGNNYTAQNLTGLINWSTTSRIDYLISSTDTLTVLGAVGRQASSVPVGQTTSGRNVGPVPYNYGQAYAPKTAVWTLEETHTFSPNLLNQVKWGYARYNGPTFNPDDSTLYSAKTMGMTGTPVGQATNMFPIVTFAGTQAPTQWNGATENSTIAENYTFLDNLQWTHGKHAFTFGGQIAWLLYNVNNATGGGSTPLTLANTVTETAAITKSSNTTPVYAATGSTGLSYASFLVGQIDTGSFTQYLQQEFGTRFRAISPYFQDDWKVTPKLSVNLGLRYDFFPTLREVHNAMSSFNPVLANPVTGINGALAYTGYGTGTINSPTPANNYYKNFGPRLGLAYQLGTKTVIRASYGIMFTHSNAVGGLATSLGGGTFANGTQGFSTSPKFASSATLLTQFPLVGTNGAIPSYSPALGVAGGPAFGTGYASTAGYTTSPASVGYADAYLGSRAPEYLNWTFGIQRQLTNAITLTATYVGSEGHFLQTDGGNARGYWADGLDPKWLYLGTALGTTADKVAAACTANNLTCPSNYNTDKTTGPALSQLLKPFPFHGVTDAFGYVGNANYNAIQVMLNMRAWHGLTLNSNYSFSRAIDDGGNFRTGYPILAGTLANHPTASFKADRYERGVSTSNQPQHFVATAVWDWPLGKTILSQNYLERAVFGGFKWSGIFQAYSGSPLALTESANQVNPAESTHMPIMNPNFTGQVRVNGKWGHGTSGDPRYPNSISYIAQSIGGKDKTTGAVVESASGPFISPVAPTTPTNQVSLLAAPSAYDYQFGDASRTAPYNLYGPSNYQLDLAMVRTFPLHITESTKLNFRAEWYNVTNHTLFGVASTAVGNGSFGQVTNSSVANRKAAQFSARISF